MGGGNIGFTLRCLFSDRIIVDINMLKREVTIYG